MSPPLFLFLPGNHVTGRSAVHKRRVSAGCRRHGCRVRPGKDNRGGVRRFIFFVFDKCEMYLTNIKLYDILCV